MFGFVYEDSDIESDSIAEYLNDNNKINIDSGLMILSGGCTMFNIANHFNSLTALDTNIEQINLVKEKISIIENNDKKYYDAYLKNIDMNFDRMFKNIKNKNDIIHIFERDNLIKNFGIDAVQNTSHNFIEHFIKVYDSNSNYHDFIFNRNMDIKTKYFYKYYENINKIKNVNIINDNMITYLENNNKKYDFIQTSNITDWICNDEFIKICSLLKSKLNKNGIIIMRRMLSDNILQNYFPNCIILHDKTNIYSETILWRNNISD